MITYVIIGVTVVVSYICFGNHELFRKLAFIPYCTVHNREWYRLITHGFVHADAWYDEYRRIYELFEKVLK